MQLQLTNQTTIFPKNVFSTPRHISGYKYWSGYDPNERGIRRHGTDKERIPTFGENLSYFLTISSTGCTSGILCGILQEDKMIFKDMEII